MVSKTTAHLPKVTRHNDDGVQAWTHIFQPLLQVSAHSFFKKSSYIYSTKLETKLNSAAIQARCYLHVILPPGRLRQEDNEFEASWAIEWALSQNIYK